MMSALRAIMSLPIAAVHHKCKATEARGTAPLDLTSLLSENGGYLVLALDTVHAQAVGF